jgi:hypothetical protein
VFIGRVRQDSPKGLAKRARDDCARPLPRGMPGGVIRSFGVGPPGGFLGIRRHLGSFEHRYRSRGRCAESLWWSGESTGHKIFGPTRRSVSRQGGVQELVESASCVAARKAGSLSPAGTAGALEASAEVTRVLHGARGISVSYCSQPTGSLASAVERRESVSPREELTFAVCPGSALVAEAHRRRSVQKAPFGCG